MTDVLKQNQIDPGSDDHWQVLQNEIADFTDRAFGQATPVSKLHHLAEEVQELIETPEDRLEWADCMILLIDAAKKAGYDMNDLYQAVQDKMEINKKRKWGAPDENGVVRHLD